MVCRKGWGKASFHCLAVLIFHNLFSLLLPCRRTSENPQARHCESWFLSPLQAIYWIHINRFPLNFGWLTLSIKVHKYKCFKKFFFLGVPEKKKPPKFLKLFTQEQPEQIIFSVSPNFCLSAFQTTSHDRFLLHLHSSFSSSQLPNCFFPLPSHRPPIWHAERVTSLSCQLIPDPFLEEGVEQHQLVP